MLIGFIKNTLSFNAYQLKILEWEKMVLNGNKNEF